MFRPILNRLRLRHYCIAALMLLVALLISRIVPVFLRSNSETPKVRERYLAMYTSLQLGDFDSARELIVPQNRKKAAHRNFTLLRRFVKPLNTNSLIVVNRDRAIIFPEHSSRFKSLNLKRLLHLGYSGQGNYLELIELEGEWYFTGAFHVD